MPSTIIASKEKQPSEDFIAFFQTSDLQYMELIKHFLQQNQIPFFVTGSDLFHLGGLALAVEEAVLTLYILPSDIEEVQEFLDESR